MTTLLLSLLPDAAPRAGEQEQREGFVDLAQRAYRLGGDWRCGEAMGAVMAGLLDGGSLLGMGGGLRGVVVAAGKAALGGAAAATAAATAAVSEAEAEWPAWVNLSSSSMRPRRASSVCSTSTATSRCATARLSTDALYSALRRWVAASTVGWLTGSSPPQTPSIPIAGSLAALRGYMGL